VTHIAGKVAVVTGAGSGIGRALALQLARRRCSLALTDVVPADLEHTAAACRRAGAADVMTSVVDAANRDAVTHHAGQVLDRFGAVHLLFNNAGIGLVAEVLEQRLDDVQRILDVNLGGVINGTQVFLPHLIASGGGHLINISSIFGMIAIPTQSAYHASKFAVRGYTEGIAVEMRMAGHPVRVSCVHPGGIATNIARNAHLRGPRDRHEVASLFDQLATTSPERAARTILRGVERNRTRIMVGADAHALHLMGQLLGSRYLGVVAAIGRRRLAALDNGSAARVAGGSTPTPPIVGAGEAAS